MRCGFTRFIKSSQCRAPKAVLLLLMAAGCQTSTSTDSIPDDASVDASQMDATIDAGDAAVEIDDPPLVLTVQSQDLNGCAYASPLLANSDGTEVIIVATDRGEVAGLAPRTLDEIFSIEVPRELAQRANITATPVIVPGNLLVVAYQVLEGPWRTAHHVVVIDIDERNIDSRFDLLTLEASKPNADGTGTVDFDPTHAFSRAALAHAMPNAATHGNVYISFGNQGDIQPWHGWVFEVDIDAWKSTGTAAAISSSLLTTPESDCGPSGVSGSFDSLCGAGVWTPAGLLVEGSGTNTRIIIPTGNGQFDLNRNDYAYSILRTGIGLNFDDGCNAVECTSWDTLNPSEECLASCSDLFVHRMPEGEPLIQPDDGQCDGLSLFECWAALDLGGSTPVRVSIPGGPDVYATVNKDGGLYIFDATHFGTLYLREQVVSFCGGPDDRCPAEWAGMFVTQPLLVETDSDPILVVNSFQYDESKEAGVVAFRLGMQAGEPTLTRLWEAPDFSSADANLYFREHPSRMTAVDYEGEPHVLIVESARQSTWQARLWLIRVSDGDVREQQVMRGNGLRYTLPLVHDDIVYLSSCIGSGLIEGHRLEASQ